MRRRCRRGFQSLPSCSSLITGRRSTKWSAHEPEALKAGVDAAVVNYIAAGRRPRFEKDDERVVCDFVTTLHETRSISEGLYRTTVAALGEQGVVELVGLLGYYTLISMTLNVFDIDAADAANPR